MLRVDIHESIAVTAALIVIYPESGVDALPSIPNVTAI
jgi:hypothetical protein